MTAPYPDNGIKYPDRQCKHCGANHWDVGMLKKRNGEIAYPFYCVNCGEKIQGYASGKAARASGIDFKEFHPIDPLKNCEVCGALGTEHHHWAPTHLFGREADNWPTAELCPTCHKKWHQLVTPNMSHQAGK